MRYASLVLLLVVAGALPAADDTRFIKLEQDVRKLEASVRELSRRFDDFRRELPVGPAPADRSASSPGAGASTAWLSAANWNRVQPGMSELDVIEVLGLPTSMRAEQGGRVLLYATEIGPSGFLGGSVTLRDGRVAEVALPVLK